MILIYAKFLIIKPSIICVADVATILDIVPDIIRTIGDNHESDGIYTRNIFVVTARVGLVILIEMLE